MVDVSRVVAITGAGGALGAAISQRFAADPMTKLVLSDASAPALISTLDSLEQDGDEIETVVADVSVFEQVEEVTTRAIESFGRMDVFIQNAGVLSPNGRIHNLTERDWEKAFQVNVMGAVNAIRASVSVMRPQRSGSIILTGSVAGMTAWSHAGPYCASKAAVIHLSRVAAVEYAPDNIRVNCVCPGVFPSAIHADLPSEAMTAMAAKHPLGLGSPDELVGAYSYLAGSDSKWTTGSAIVVDGGYAAP
jgi:meso-butanediol dehydrogenase/(S,S)-butanediol dehydrogenase/diacetyl reductase